MRKDRRRPGDAQRMRFSGERAKRSEVRWNRWLCGQVKGVERGTGSIEDRRDAWEPADRGSPGGRTRANADATEEDLVVDAATRTAENRTPDRPGALRCGAARNNGTETRPKPKDEAAFDGTAERPGDRAGDWSEATWRLGRSVRCDRTAETAGLGGPWTVLESATFFSAALPAGVPRSFAGTTQRDRDLQDVRQPCLGP